MIISLRLLTKLLCLSALVFSLSACDGDDGDDDDDESPESFSFTDEDDAPLAVFITSDEILVEDINTEVDISIENRDPERDGQGEYSVNGGGWTDEVREVNDGDRVRVRVFTADTIDTVVETTLIIGDQEDTFSVRTAEVALSAQADFKALNFTWPLVEGADFYRLFEDLSGSENDFAQVGREIEGDVTGLRLDIAVHRFPWEQAIYQLEACTDIECSFTTPIPVNEFMLDSIGYFKATNVDEGDVFSVVALSLDGDTLAVGAPGEDSAFSGFNRGSEDNSAPDSGAVYIFTKDDSEWIFQSYIKASNTDAGDAFGASLALSADGNTLVVGAPNEDSAATNVNGEQGNDALEDSGAAYVFRRQGSAWIQQSYLKASNPGAGDRFGTSVALSTLADAIAVGAIFEDGSVSGINGADDNLAADAGAVYLFEQIGDSWQAQAYVKASNSDVGDHFGSALALSAGGDVLTVGAWGEQSNSRAIGSGGDDNSLNEAGAAYVYILDAGAWQFESYLKAANTATGQRFGEAIAISQDGLRIAVGAPGEASNSAETPEDLSSENAGAVYLFSRANTQWSQSAYVKANVPEAQDGFGSQVALNAIGNALFVSAPGEDGSALGVNGEQNDNAATDSGAVYVFSDTAEGWQQDSFVKAPNSELDDGFGSHLSVDASGDVLAIGAPSEQSASTGVAGEQGNNDVPQAGAVYLY